MKMKWISVFLAAIIMAVIVAWAPAMAASQYIHDLKVGTLSGVSSFTIDDSSMAFGTDGAGGDMERETDTGDDGPYLADADTITFADGVAAVGDRIDIVSNGSYFYVTGQVNKDGALTITQAD